MESPTGNPPPPPPNGAAEDASRLLQRFLRERDVECPVCGYNLRNLVGERCPECGQEMALRVGQARAHYGRLVACLMPLLMMFGLTVFFFAMMLRYGPPSRRVWFYFVFATGLVDGIIAAAIYARRARFTCLPDPRQNAAVAAAWLLNAIAFTIAMFVIR